MTDTIGVTLGWCIAKQHDKCPKRVLLTDQNKTAVCNCTCHKGENE